MKDEPVLVLLVVEVDVLRRDALAPDVGIQRDDFLLDPGLLVRRGHGQQRFQLGDAFFLVVGRF
ncbi:hypothetical protein D3C72_2512310 [compost metagenome]